MLQYPSIDGASKAPIGEHCIAFVKYDGSNLRWEWSPKKGWNKFGTRRQMLDKSTPIFCEAIPIFMDELADQVVDRTKQLVKNPERITVFTELFGPSSFAGKHVEGEQKELQLFDVFLFKKGFVTPDKFVEIYGDLKGAAEVVYEGELSREFIADVRAGKYPVHEGVIAKGSGFSVKLKTQAWYDKLHSQGLQEDE